MSQLGINHPHREFIGKRFGRLVIVSFSRKDSSNYVFWNCICDCGTVKEIRHYSLVKAHSRSCGCLQRECVAARTIKHGRSHTKEHTAWKNMKRRCGYSGGKDDKYYSKKGITVCAEWASSFETFFRDMGVAPTKNHSIDRIDGNLGYSKENCRWATSSEQALNKSSIFKIAFNGKSKTISEWSREIMIGQSTIRRRIEEGLPAHLILSPPNRPWHKKRLVTSCIPAPKQTGLDMARHKNQRDTPHP